MKWAKQCVACKKEGDKQRNKKWRKELPNDPEKYNKELARKRSAYRRSVYGISEIDYKNMKENQNNECAICSIAFTEEPNIDHCHESKAIRALLCKNCNLGLGNFKDDVNLMQAAIAYIVKHKGKGSPVA